MKKLPCLLLLALGLSLNAAHAAGATEAKPQKVRLGCSKQAGDRKGEDYKKFMAECATAQRKSDDTKLAACRKQADAEKGKAATRAKMKECMAKG